MVGDLSFFSSIQIKQTNSGIFVSQKEKYALSIVKRIELPKHMKTRMSSSLKQSKDNVDITLYHIMIGSLLYLC